MMMEIGWLVGIAMSDRVRYVGRVVYELIK